MSKRQPILYGRSSEFAMVRFSPKHFKPKQNKITSLLNQNQTNELIGLNLCALNYIEKYSCIYTLKIIIEASDPHAI